MSLKVRIYNLELKAAALEATAQFSCQVTAVIPLTLIYRVSVALALQNKTEQLHKVIFKPYKGMI